MRSHTWHDSSRPKGVFAADDTYYEKIRKKVNKQRHDEYNKILSEVSGQI